MTPNMERGARIIIHEWVKVRAWDKITDRDIEGISCRSKSNGKEASGKARSVNTPLCREQGAPCRNLLMIMKQF